MYQAKGWLESYQNPFVERENHSALEQNEEFFLYDIQFLGALEVQ